MAPSKKKQNTTVDCSSVVSGIICIPMEEQSEESIRQLLELFENLEKDDVRKAVLPLTKFDSWASINGNMRDHLFADHPKLANLYAKGLRTYNKDSKDERFFQINFVSDLVDYLLNHIERSAVDEPSPVVVAMLDLSIVLLSQLPTRRCVRPIFIDRLFEERVGAHSVYRLYTDRICDLLHFPLNDFTAEPLTKVDQTAALENMRDTVRQICWKNGFTEIGLSANATLFSSEERIKNFLRSISPAVIEEIVKHGFFLEPQRVTENFVLAVFVNRSMERKKRSETPLLPTEIDIDNKSSVITKLGLQYLSFSDYFSRNSELFFAESVHVISSTVEEVVNRMQPEFSAPLGKHVFKGAARMGIQAEKSEIVFVKQGMLSSASSVVRAEVTVDLKRVIPSVALEWDSLKPGDCVILVKLSKTKNELSHLWSQKNGIEWIRGATLSELVDIQGNAVGSFAAVVGDTRVMRVSMDPQQYAGDIGINVDYSHANLVVRLKSSEVKNVLWNLKRLARDESVKVPDWIHDILLGYGDPSACSTASLNDTVTSDDPLAQAMMKGLTIINGGPGTGKSRSISAILDSWYSNALGKTLLVAKTAESLTSILSYLTRVPREYLVKLGGAPDDKFGRQMTINYILQLRMELLAKVKNIAMSLGLDKLADDYAFSCENAHQMLLNRVQPAIDQYMRTLEKAKGREQDALTLKIRDGYIRREALMSLPGWSAEISDAKKMSEILLSNNSLEVIMFPFRVYYQQIGMAESLSLEPVLEIFEKLREVSAFEVLRNLRDRSQFLTTRQSRIVAITSTGLANLRDNLVNQGFRYDNVIVEDCGQMQDFEAFSALVAQKDSSNLQRMVLVGDDQQLPPVVTNRDLFDRNNFGITLFSRLIRLGCHKVTLNQQVRSPSFITNLWASYYPGLTASPATEYAVPGLTYESQFVDLPDPQGESQPMIHFYQNLDEAEYIVSLYMYLRLKGVDSSQISIIASYNGQRMLIQDVLKARCAGNALFGEPAVVTTIDQYQGQENDIVLVSLVRTEAPGHNADVRRLICALSRARVACYIFGRLDLYAAVQGDVGSVIGRMVERRESKLSLESVAGRVLIDSQTHMNQVLEQEMRDQLRA